MGEVWRAEDTRLLRPVAIKILSEKIANDPEWKARFLREARTVAQMNHPNIATIYAIEQEGDTFFIAMELVEGESLGALLERGPIPPKESVRIITEVAEALGEAHEKGIVHRDVKPDNIIVGKRGVKVLDFGIAKQTNPTPADTNTLTQSGMIVGTPYYMSPEQARGKVVDSRSDIFSVGVVLYEMITGRRPFDGETATETMMNIIMQEARDVSEVRPKVPRALADVIRRALQKRVEARFATAGEMIQAMERIEFDTPSPETLARHAPTQMLSTPAPEVPAKPKRDPIPGHRALVADDDPAARESIGSILSQNGITFDEASNGADAVKSLKARDYTLLFLDLVMPRVDGWGVIDFLRRAKSTKLPRVFAIASVKDQPLSAADRDIVTGLLLKPLDVAEIEKVIRQSVPELAGKG
jgi:serine/threonine protein kinase